MKYLHTYYVDTFKSDSKKKKKKTITTNGYLHVLHICIYFKVYTKPLIKRFNFNRLLDGKKKSIEYLPTYQDEWLERQAATFRIV